MPKFPLWPLLFMIGAIALLGWFLLRGFRLIRGFRETRGFSQSKCVCGYALFGLDIPRCPECGRAFGFSKSFDELGMSEKDVMEHIRRRREELRGKALPEETKEALQALDEMESRLNRQGLPPKVIAEVTKRKTISHEFLRNPR